MSLFHRTITASPGTLLVEYVRGISGRVLEPGQHRRPLNATYVTVLGREQVTDLAGLEVATADRRTIRVSTAVRWTVVDARRYVEVATSPFTLVELAVEVALRDALALVDEADAMAQLRVVVPDALRHAARATGAEVGIGVAEVLVKDVQFAPELIGA